MAHFAEAVTMEMKLKHDPNTNLAFSNNKSHGKPGSLLHRLHVKRLIVMLDGHKVALPSENIASVAMVTAELTHRLHRKMKKLRCVGLMLPDDVELDNFDSIADVVRDGEMLTAILEADDDVSFDHPESPPKQIATSPLSNASSPLENNRSPTNNINTSNINNQSPTSTIQSMQTLMVSRTTQEDLAVPSDDASQKKTIPSTQSHAIDTAATVSLPPESSTNKYHIDKSQSSTNISNNNEPELESTFLKPSLLKKKNSIGPAWRAVARRSKSPKSGDNVISNRLSPPRVKTITPPRPLISTTTPSRPIKTPPQHVPTLHEPNTPNDIDSPSPTPLQKEEESEPPKYTDWKALVRKKRKEDDEQDRKKYERNSNISDPQKTTQVEVIKSSRTSTDSEQHLKAIAVENVPPKILRGTRKPEVVHSSEATTIQAQNDQNDYYANDSDYTSTSDSASMKTWPPQAKPAVFTIPHNLSSAPNPQELISEYQKVDLEQIMNNIHDEDVDKGIRKRSSVPTTKESDSDSTNDGDVSSVSASQYETDEFLMSVSSNEDVSSGSRSLSKENNVNMSKKKTIRNYKRNITGSLDTVSSLGMSTIEEQDLGTKIETSYKIDNDDILVKITPSKDADDKEQNEISFHNNEKKEVENESSYEKKSKEPQKIISQDAHQCLKNLMLRSSLSQLEEAKDKLHQSVKHLSHAKLSHDFPTTLVPPMQSTSHYHHYLIHQPHHHGYLPSGSSSSTPTTTTTTTTKGKASMLEKLSSTTTLDNQSAHHIAVLLEERRKAVQELIPLSMSNPPLKVHQQGRREGVMSQRMRQLHP